MRKKPSRKTRQAARRTYSEEPRAEAVLPEPRSVREVLSRDDIRGEPQPCETMPRGQTM
jgi:hypothetical protein